MRTAILTLATIGLLLASVGGAQACPRCDPGSGDNWWSTADVGADGNATGPVHHGLDTAGDENTGVGLAHSDDHKGFWAFVSICFEAWSNKLSKLTGFDVGLKGKADVYADSHVVDAKARVLGQDTTKLVKVNDTTWQAESQVRGTVKSQTGVDVPIVPALPTEKLPELNGNVCVEAKVTVQCV